MTDISAEIHAGSAGRPAAWARLMVLAAVVLLTVRLIEAEPLQSANDRSRWTTVWSLVERGTYRIDEIRSAPGWDTIDKVLHEGHFYSSKPPLLSTLVAGLYWCAKHTLGWTLQPADQGATARTTALILWLVNILPTWIALESLCRLVWRFAGCGWTRGLVLTAAGFGTLWSAYLPSLNNHTPALCCTMLALAALVVESGRQPGDWRCAWAGLMAGFAAMFELPAVALLAGLGVWVGWRRRRALLPFLLAAAVPVAGHFVTNHLVTGSWKPFYAAYGTEKYLYYDQGAPSYWLDPKGVDAARDSFGTYLLHCTVGHHGLLSLTPLLLLSIAGGLLVQRWKSTPLAAVHALGLALTVVVFGFYLSRPAHFNYGGVSVGLRWMIWLVPFWLLLLLPAGDFIASSRSGRCMASLLLAASIFSAWHPFHGPWRQPWLFDWMQARGWIDYRDPPPQFGRIVRSWIVQLPDGEARQPDYWTELTGTDIDGAAQTLRIADGGPVEAAGRAGRRIDITWNAGLPSQHDRHVVLDVERFNRGEEVSNCLLWPEGPPSEAVLGETVEFLQGTPQPAEYRCRTVRYLHLPLRDDAFRASVGVAAAGRRTNAPGIAAVLIRSEIWVGLEIPFGLAVWDTQTSNYSTRTILANRRLTVVRAGRLMTAPATAPETPH